MLAEAADHLTDDGVLIVEVGNSQVHVQALYPEVDFTRLEFTRGGHGVFLLAAQQCRKHQALFRSRGGELIGFIWKGVALESSTLASPALHGRLANLAEHLPRMVVCIEVRSGICAAGWLQFRSVSVRAVIH